MEKLDKKEVKLMDTIVRKIWFCINTIVFGGKFIHPSPPIQSSRLKYRSFKVGFFSQHRLIKVNWNATIDKSRKMMRVAGVIVRDYELARGIFGNHVLH